LRQRLDFFVAFTILQYLPLRGATRHDVPGSCSSRRNDSGQVNLIPHCVEFIMRRSSWTPSIVPNDNDETVYLVADDFRRLGRAWREADYATTDLETVIQDLLTGQYNNPIRVVAFNTAERWSEDVSEDVAHELRRRCNLQTRDLPPTISDAWNGSARRA
jgi:hypothetical protein